MERGCYVWWNDGVMFGGMKMLCWMEWGCYAGWNEGVMFGGMMGLSHMLDGMMV